MWGERHSQVTHDFSCCPAREKLQPPPYFEPLHAHLFVQLRIRIDGAVGFESMILHVPPVDGALVEAQTKPWSDERDSRKTAGLS